MSTKVKEVGIPYTPDPRVIEQFFCYCGEASNINETLWDMFSESISLVQIRAPAIRQTLKELSFIKDSQN